MHTFRSLLNSFEALTKIKGPCGCSGGDDKLETKKVKRLGGVIMAATSGSNLKRDKHRRPWYLCLQAGAGRAHDGRDRGRLDCGKRDQPHRR